MSTINIGLEELEPVSAEQPVVNNIISLLKKAVCDETTAEYQYIIAAHMARGAGYCDAVPEYLQHANEERDHKFKLLKRLEQLGAMFSLDLVGLSNSGNPWTPINHSSIKDQLEVLIKAEADAQSFYNKILEQARAQHDEITIKVIRGLLEDECEHETDLRRIIEQF